jgi:diguanylate cyclase (GGDEF)-like protein
MDRFIACFTLPVLIGFLCLSTNALASPSISLTPDEATYLANKGPIRMCVDPNWMPYERINAEGEYEGMGADYLRLFAERADLELRLHPTGSWQETLNAAERRECDIISMARNTQQRRRFMNFTTPYVAYPYVIATTTDKFFIDDIRQYPNKTFAVVRGYAASQYLKDIMPDVNLLPVDNIYQGLEKLREREVFGYIDSILSIGYAISKESYVDLKISGKLDFSSRPSVAVRKDEPLLLSIFQKAMDSVSESERQRIYNQWFAIRFEHGFDYQKFIQVIVAIVVLLGALLIWNRKLATAHKTTRDTLSQLHKTQKVLEEKNVQLKHLASTDLLTGLYNRLKVENSLQREFERQQRFGQNFSIILLDIDHFKRVNDIHGHQIGDQVLIEFSGLLREHVRSVDIVGRWGGEEFMIVCPGTDEDGVTGLASKLKAAIEYHHFATVGQQTASFGTTTIRDEDDIQQLILRADKAMYQAKHEGRNKVIFYKDEARV